MKYLVRLLETPAIPDYQPKADLPGAGHRFLWLFSILVRGDLRLIKETESRLAKVILNVILNLVQDPIIVGILDPETSSG